MSAIVIEELARELAPTGKFRAAINLGNVVLAQADAQGQLNGVSVILARELAARLNLPLDLIPVPIAKAAFDALAANTCDMAFLAVEPERAAEIAFTQPYVFIEATYMVRRGAPFHTVADLDRDGIRIAVGRGAAYDLYLSRTLRNAEIVRAPTSAAAVDLFLSGGLEAAAGVRQYLVERSGALPDTRLLDGSFSRIEQAIGLPKGRPKALAYVRGFLEEMKKSDAIRRALDATGQTSAIVAPPIHL